MRQIIAAALQASAFILAAVGSFIQFGVGCGLLATALCAGVFGLMVEHA